MNRMAVVPGVGQQSELEAMLMHASKHSPYYGEQAWAERLRSGGEICLHEDIAVTPKSTVRDETSIFYADSIPDGDGKVHDKYTSGSTGEPMLIRKTARHFQINTRENIRLKEGWKLGRHRKVLSIKSARDDAPFGSVEEHRDQDRMRWTLLGLDAEKGLTLLRTSGASMLHCYPSIAHEILNLADERGETLELILASTVGEVLTDDFRALARERFNCRILDVYGLIETGIVAASCAFCDAYHPADRHLVLEVLRDDGAPAAPGEIGRVVATPLFNLAMPLLRYETGDYVELGGSDACPRSLVSISRIIGRERNMFTLPDGRKITPMIPAKIALALGIRQFKLVQTTVRDVELRYVLSDGNDPVTVESVQSLVDTYLSKSLKGVPVRVLEIPRAASGKYLMHESLVA